MSPRVWSLADIMNRLKAEQLAVLMVNFDYVGGLASFQEAYLNKVLPPDNKTLATVPNLINCARAAFTDVGLKRSLEQLEMAEWELSRQNLNTSTLQAQIDRVAQTLIVELKERRFLFVAPDRTDLLERDDLFGPDVSSRFPGASFDIKEAGNCLAAECNTAAVFHLMRAVEWSLRRLCEDLGLRKVAINKKRGTFAPVEYSEWEKILDQLQGKIDKRIERAKRGPRKQALQEYYVPIMQDFRAFKDAWRNHTMHTRQEFDRVRAGEIFGRVRDFMQRVAIGEPK